MLGSLLSLVAASCFFSHFYPLAPVDMTTVSFSLLFISQVLLAVALFAICFSWQPIWKSQEKMIACTQELFRQDRVLKLELVWFFLFSLFSLAYTFLPHDTLPLIQLILISLWIVAFGVSFDMLRAFLARLFSYTDYDTLVEKLTHALQKAMRNQEEVKALEWIGAAIDSAFKAMQNGKVSHVSKTFAAMHRLVETYVKEEARRESLAPPQPEAVAPMLTDKVNYLSVYVCDRLQWIYESAFRMHAFPVAEEVISEYGKLAIFFSRYNLRVAAIPISFITTCVMQAKKQEAFIRASLTLSETCKALLVQAKERNESLREVFLSTLMAMEAIVKELYKQNKEINPVLLMQPFAEVAELLGQDFMKQVPDREEILREIRRILTQFQSLELVVQNLEEVTGVGEDSTATYKQDMPYMR